MNSVSRRIERAPACRRYRRRRHWRRSGMRNRGRHEGRERARRHGGAEIGAADADVDDVGERPARSRRAASRRGSSSAKASELLARGEDVGHHVRPSTMTGRPEKLRSAMCSAGRCSVLLIFSPANIASRFASRPAARASTSRCASVASVMRCLEKSKSEVVETAGSASGSDRAPRGRAPRSSGGRLRRDALRAPPRPPQHRDPP